MIEERKLPKKSDIKSAVLEYLTTVESATPKEINNFIIQKFDIPEKDYTAVNDYENTTIFAYRMCWVRTELRNEGKITSPKKGIWMLVRK